MHTTQGRGSLGREQLRESLFWQANGGPPVQNGISRAFGQTLDSVSWSQISRRLRYDYAIRLICGVRSSAMYIAIEGACDRMDGVLGRYVAPPRAQA